MSKQEADAVMEFVKKGGLIIADGRPALFNENGRRLKEGLLDSLFGEKLAREDVLSVRDLDSSNDSTAKMIEYHKQRLVENEETMTKEYITGLLNVKLGNDRKAVNVKGLDGKPVTGVEITTWKNGNARIAAVQRNRQFRLNEMAHDKKYHTNKRFEKKVKLILTADGVCYDMRKGGLAGKEGAVIFTLDPWEPQIFCIMPKEVTPFTFEPAGPYKPGEALKVSLIPSKECVLETPVYHIKVFDPKKKRVSLYEQNVVIPPKGDTVLIPFAANDMPGKWTVTAREVFTGTEKSITVILP
jgi:hypothetical protein